MEKKRKRHRFGIQSKIMLTTTCIIIVVSFVLSLSMQRSMKNLSQQILLDTMQPMTKTASQAVESNLHLLADRVMMTADQEVLQKETSTKEERHRVMAHLEECIEFVWIGLYGSDGNYLDGVNECPLSLEETDFFAMLSETQNLVIDDTKEGSEGLEIAVGVPVWNEKKELLFYLIGSYRYDIIHDVLANINLGATGNAVIINQEGVVMAAKETALIGKQEGIAGCFGAFDEAANLQEKMVSGEMGTRRIPQGKDALLISYAPVRGTNWSMAVSVYQSDFMEIVDESVYFSVILVFLMIVLAGIVTFCFAATISKPLKKLTGRIEGLAKGDLKTSVEVLKSRDETGTLSVSLKKTVEEINGYITDLGTVLEEMAKGNLNVRTTAEFQGDFAAMKQSLDYISDSLNVIMREITESVGMLAETSRIVCDNSRLVDQSSQDQARSVTQLSESSQVISKNIESVSENTIEARDLMDTSKKCLDNGTELMRQLVVTMEQIREDFDQVTKINKFLSDIAFQTNILSLNAAVEASRAGEAGKGFAVVAQQVRDLAGKTAQSAQSASEIIENSRRSIVEGTSLASKTAGSMTEIAEISQRVSEITGRLSASVEEEQDSLAEILEEIQSISDLAQRNTQVSVQSLNASSELAGQAENLRSLASKFTLKK